MQHIYNSKSDNTVESISISNMCCSCGACVSICPKKAISYVETIGGHLLPKIDLYKCNQCGICKSICPGVHLAPNQFCNHSLDPFTGFSLKTFVGKAINKTLYNNSQSGGIVSAILVHALNSGKIAGALTSVMVAGNPPRVVPMYAKNIEEIIQAQKSKYCPIPLLSVLDEIEKLEKPIAVVGVACQIHGLLNLFDRFPHLKEKIAFTIGLICDRTMTYAAIDYLIKKANGSVGTSTILHFRDKMCGGHPGNVNVIYSNNLSVSMPASIRINIKDFFTPPRCRICFDKMNVFSDITVGDPWGIDGIDRKGGESVAIVRTEKGMNVFQDVINNNAVNVREIIYNEVLVGQKIEEKRSDWRGYIKIWKSLGKFVPDYYEYIQKYSKSNIQRNNYKRNLQHAFSLDQYPSRKALIEAAEKHLFFQSLKRIFTIPLRVFKKIFEKVVKLQKSKKVN